MFRQIFLSAFILYLGYIEAAPERDRIVNGVTAFITEIPFQVLVRPGNYLCGGSILSKDWVVTAAHCTYRLKAIQISFVVGANKNANIPESNIYQTKELAQHENYNPSTFDSDIALLKAERSILINSYAQIIPIYKSEVPTGAEVIVSGYGTTSSGGQASDTLMKTTLKITDFLKCKAAYPDLTENQICAANPNTDSCQGDSGGPLVYQKQLIGIVSYGNGCAKPGYPGVYTKVLKYTKWISDRFNGVPMPATTTTTPPPETSYSYSTSPYSSYSYSSYTSCTD